MRGQRNPSAVVAMGSALLFVKNFDARIIPLPGDYSCHPNVEKDVVKAQGECGVI